MTKKRVVLCLLFIGFIGSAKVQCPEVDSRPPVSTFSQPVVLIVVRSGWSLLEIAQGVGMNLQSLVETNSLQNPNRIYPGEILKTRPYSDCPEVVVSWYEDGTERADGKPFNPSEVTVAHKWLPFGTQVRLTRTDNHQSIIVTVYDRGPYVSGRDFDLSRGAACKLGILKQGVVHCFVEIISSPD